MESTDMAKATVEAARHKRRRRLFFVAAAVGAAGLAVAAAALPPEVWLRLKETSGAALEWVRGLGTGWFFAAFAVLPAVGCPVSAFALSAGPLFGPLLGLPTVLALAGLCTAASLTISYGLARYLLRPWVIRLLGYLGYKAPVVPPGKHRMFTVLVRVTPGSPYVFQSFLLGLAEVPFGLYLAISWVISTASISLMIVFGDALARGQIKVALLALLGVVLVVAAFKVARRVMAKRAGSAAAGLEGGGTGGSGA